MERGSQRATESAPPGAFLTQALPAVLLLVLLSALGYAGFSRAQKDAVQPVVEAWIDPASSALLRAPEWSDPRWLEHLHAVLEQYEPFAVRDAEAVEDLCGELAGLSFVAAIESCAASDEGGLTLDLTLRRPVACVPVGAEFALVDEQGVVLEGRWPVPPRLGRAPLPVLGPAGDALLGRARSGDWLAEPEHLDALDVACSLTEHVDEEARASLGRIVIDARRARGASAIHPGVVLQLEGARRALFGRPPRAGEPGELAAASKWRSLVRALELYEEDPELGDWEIVDLRWDRPDLALRRESRVAAVVRSPERVGGSEPRARREPDPTVPRVR